MSKLHLQGYLCMEDGVAIKNKQEDYRGREIVESIEEFANDNGVCWDTDGDGLGGTKSVIKDVNLYIYITEKECTLDEAMTALLYKFDGVCETETSLDGYSEYTITGMNVDTFEIGGHNIEQELSQYIGKYIHFVMEC